MSIWFVTPAYQRFALSVVCFEQRARVIKTLADQGIEAHCVVVADDANLDVARGLGFDTVERDNEWLGRKFNDGMEYAGNHGATWIVPIGSDSWIDPAYFVPLPEVGTRTSMNYCAVKCDRLAELRVADGKGAGPFMFHRDLLAPTHFRPAEDKRQAAIDGSTLRGIGVEIDWRPNDLHPYQYIGFRGTPHITRYDRLVNRWGGVEHEDPWGILAQHYPGRSRRGGSSGAVNHAMTRGLLLSAGHEPERLTAELDEMARPMGWGLPFAWDAFRDGTVNPPETSYACTTAFVIAGLLDAGRASEREADIALRWAQHAWTGGFYWYSEHLWDAIYTPNASALLAGSSQRLLHERPDLFAAGEFLADTTNGSMARLLSTVQPGLRWRYSDHADKPNCLLHDGFTLWGIEVYRESGGSVVIPWQPKEAALSLAGRTDVAGWPAGGPAMRYLLARRAGLIPDPADLEAIPNSTRDAAFQAWARK